MRTLEGWLVAAVFPPVNGGRKRIPFSDVIVRMGDKIHSHEKHTLCFKFSQSECPQLDISQGYLSNTQSKTWIPVGPCSFGPRIPADPQLEASNTVTDDKVWQGKTRQAVKKPVVQV